MKTVHFYSIFTIYPFNNEWVLLEICTFILWHENTFVPLHAYHSTNKSTQIGSQHDTYVNKRNFSHHLKLANFISNSFAASITIKLRKCLSEMQKIHVLTHFFAHHLTCKWKKMYYQNNYQTVRAQTRINFPSFFLSLSKGLENTLFWNIIILRSIYVNIDICWSIF